MNKIEKLKPKECLLNRLTGNEDILKNMILVDIGLVLSILDREKNTENKRIVAKAFSSYIFLKYSFDDNNRTPENGLDTLLDNAKDSNYWDTIVSLFTYCDFISDNNNPEKIEKTRKEIESFVDSL